MNFHSWKSDLEIILPHLRRVALGSAVLKIFPVSDRVALGIPLNRALAGEVIRLYRPMKRKARLLVRLLEGVSRSGMLRAFRKKVSVGIIPEISWLRGPCDLGFLGCNPSHGVRCVLLSRGGDDMLKVTKLAIGGNLGSVVAEAEKLREWGVRYRGLPTFGEAETGPDWAAFWTNHVAARGPQSVVEKGVIELLAGWLRPEIVIIGELSWVKTLSQRLRGKQSESLGKQQIRSALLHGDFAAWNLRGSSSGLIAIDWEWGREDGLGGLDLGHGLIMEAMLVKGLRGARLVDEVLAGARRLNVSGYLERCGWRDLHLWCLLSLLYSGEQTGNEIDRELSILQHRMEKLPTI